MSGPAPAAPSDPRAPLEARLASHPDDPTALGRLGMLLAQRGDMKGAAARFARLVEVTPGHGQAWRALGKARLALGDLKGALDPLRRAVDLAPQDSQAAVDLSAALLASGDPERAAHAARHALSVAPGDVPAAVNLGTALAMTGAHAEALEVLQGVARRAPERADVRHNMARALVALDRRAEARAQLDEALALAPTLGPALRSRAELLAEEGDAIGALADVDAALAQRPGDAALRGLRARIALAMGDALGAATDMEARRDAPGFRRPATAGGAAPADWRGEPLDGRSLLLYAEQKTDDDRALLDALLHLRFAPLLAARGARLRLETPAALAPLLAEQPPTAPLRRALSATAAYGEPAPAADLCAPLASLPHLATLDDPDAAPAPGAWLAADPTLTARARRRSQGAAEGPVLGVALPGALAGAVNPPDGVRLINVAAADGAPLVELAARIAACDLVLTTLEPPGATRAPCGVAAMLALALDRPLWLAVGPGFDPRVGLQGEAGPALPGARLFRGAPAEQGPAISAALERWKTR